MRILVATDQWFPNLRGGLARVARDTACALAARGHDVTVIAPRHAGEPDETRDGGVTVLRVLPRTWMPQTLSDVVATMRAARRLRGSRFDVVLAHHPSCAVGLVAARLRAPLVFTYHASIPRELRFLRSRLRFGRQRLATYGQEAPLVLFERIALRRAAKILVLSEFSRSLLDHDHPEIASRVVRVSGGVDADRFRPGDGGAAERVRVGVPPGVARLVTVRRLEPRMGLESLVRAVGLLRRSRPVVLAIVGRGSLDDDLRRLASELGLAADVEFLGGATDEELHALYRGADLFVLPTVAYEGFGMATLEALATGTPVVGTPVGATPELLRPLAPDLVASGTDPDALAAAITRGLQLATPEFRERCREYAYTRFAWTSVIETWEQALAEVVTDGAALAVPAPEVDGAVS